MATPEFKAVWDADWMVNFPGRYRDKSNEKRAQLIDTICMTVNGQYMARREFLAASRPLR